MQIFVVDDSESMQPWWLELKQLIKILTYLLEKCSPDGIKTYLTVYGRAQPSKKSAMLAFILEGHVPLVPSGRTDIGHTMKVVLEEYVDKSRWYTKQPEGSTRAPRPLSVYVLTNGVWASGADAKTPILETFAKMKRLALPRQHLSIEFITFGLRQNNEALRRFADLGVYPMVGTEPSDGNVWKMLLGPGYHEADEKGMEPQDVDPGTVNESHQVETTDKPNVVPDVDVERVHGLVAHATQDGLSLPMVVESKSILPGHVRATQGTMPLPTVAEPETRPCESRDIPVLVKGTWVCVGPVFELSHSMMLIAGQGCGSVVQDWFMEQVPGSVKRAMEEIAREQGTRGAQEASGGQRSGRSGTDTAGQQPVSLAAYHAMLRYFGRDKPKASRASPQADVRDVELQQRQPDTPRFLFTCVTQERNYRLTEMVPIRLDLSEDDELFGRMREAFKAVLGYWRRYMMVKRLVDIRFVKVGLASIIIFVPLTR